jgi:hypothetical protein
MEQGEPIEPIEESIEESIESIEEAITVQDSTADALMVLEVLDKLREHLSAFPSSPPNFAIDMSSSDEDDC